MKTNPAAGGASPAAAARRLRRAIRAALLQRAAWGALVFGLLLADRRRGGRGRRVSGQED